MASFISEDNIEQALLQRLQYIHGFKEYRVSLRRRQLFHHLKNIDSLDHLCALLTDMEDRTSSNMSSLILMVIHEVGCFEVAINAVVYPLTVTEKP